MSYYRHYAIKGLRPFSPSFSVAAFYSVLSLLSFLLLSRIFYILISFSLNYPIMYYYRLFVLYHFVVFWNGPLFIICLKGTHSFQGGKGTLVPKVLQSRILIRWLGSIKLVQTISVPTQIMRSKKINKWEALINFTIG